MKGGRLPAPAAAAIAATRASCVVIAKMRLLCHRNGECERPGLSARLRPLIADGAVQCRAAHQRRTGACDTGRVAGVVRTKLIPQEVGIATGHGYLERDDGRWSGCC